MDNQFILANARIIAFIMLYVVPIFGVLVTAPASANAPPYGHMMIAEYHVSNDEG